MRIKWTARLVGVVVGMGLAARVGAAPMQIPFDRAYLVAESGSTEAVEVFELGAGRPVLYLDLPAARGSYSWGSSTWTLAHDPSVTFTVGSEGWFTSEEEYWLTPPAEVWNVAEGVGEWDVTANYGWWELVIIYGAGAPVTYAQGSAAVDFHVTLPKIPEPGGVMIAGVGVVMGMMRRRAKVGA